MNECMLQLCAVQKHGKCLQQIRSVRSLTRRAFGGSEHCCKRCAKIMVASTCNSDLSNDLQYEVLGQQVWRHLPIQYKPDARRNLDEQLASSQDETSICVADARGKLTKGASIAGVGICPKHDLTCASNSTSDAAYMSPLPLTGQGLNLGSDVCLGQQPLWYALYTRLIKTKTKAVPLTACADIAHCTA